ncbi:MAG: hypothetical protein GEU28_10535 [Dehalococcoidia bacterium]|nr:hypothetical protein [Dehalococcoidia bacterium]
MTITQLMAAGNFSPQMVAALWMGLENGASIVIASDPPSSGKTTTLTALLPFFPPDALLYFTRGLGEDFSLPPPGAEGPVYLMVNEISDHLPVYSWGSYVQRIFELMADGYAMASTMHCDTTEEVIEQLMEQVGVTPSLVGHLTLVVPLEVRRGPRGVVRRALEVAMLRPSPEGPLKSRLGHWSPITESFVAPSPEEISGFAAYLARDAESVAEDLATRAGVLADLAAAHAGSEEIERAIQNYRESQVTQT